MPATFADMLVRIREQGHPAILDRATVVADAEKHLTPWLDLMQDLVNYGTNLIVRCLHTNDKTTKNRVVLAVLLRQAVAMLDGAEVLLSKGCTHDANLQMRALFEAATYIEWILANDSERRARYYHVHNLRRKRLWGMRTQPGSPEAAAFAIEMGKFGLTPNAEQQKKAQEQVAAIDHLLALPELAPINLDYETIRKARKLKRDVAWYVPLGQKTFAGIARSVGSSAMYALLYSTASEVMHSSSDEPHIEVGGGKVMIRPIRSLAGFETVFRFCVSFALALYRRIIEEYRPGELASFSRKYIEEWQKQYLNFLKIEYHVTTKITI